MSLKKVVVKITLKLYATLMEYLPREADGHAAELDVDSAATPLDVLDEMHIPHEQAHLIVVNGHYVDLEKRDQAIFKSGDVLAIWPPVAGG